MSHYHVLFMTFFSCGIVKSIVYQPKPSSQYSLFNILWFDNTHHCRVLPLLTINCVVIIFFPSSVCWDCCRNNLMNMRTISGHSLPAWCSFSDGQWLPPIILLYLPCEFLSWFFTPLLCLTHWHYAKSFSSAGKFWKCQYHFYWPLIWPIGFCNLLINDEELPTNMQMKRWLGDY